MQNVDSLLHARWVIPVEPDDLVLEQHSVAITDGRIVALMPTEQAQQSYQAKVVHNLSEHALLPGLINAHTHASMSLMRGMADDLPLMTWLNDHIWPAEARWVSTEYVRAGAQLALAEMLRGGITCFNDMYFFPGVVAEAVRAAGMRAVLGLIVIEFPSAYARDADEYLSKGLELHDSLLNERLLHCALAPHAPYTVSGPTLQRIQQIAEIRDLPIHMHVHETAAEIEQWQQQHGQRPLHYLAELGLMSPQLAAVHMTQLLDAEIEQVAATGISVLHCPESNLKLASGFCPVARLLEADINVAIGTDGAASNNDLDMFGEMRVAAQLAKAVAGDAAAVPAHTALRMATLNGAKALGIDQYTGSLEVGKDADIIAVDLSWPETQPVFNPVSQLVYACGRQQVSDVWVAGRQLLRQRELTTLDTVAILAQAQAWGLKLRNSEAEQASKLA